MKRFGCYFIGFLLLVFLGFEETHAQVDCPAMAISRPSKSMKRMVGGFGSFRSGNGSQGRMPDFFSSRSRGSSSGKEFSEFSTRNGKSRLFRDMDEFASRSHSRGNKYSSFDEFSSRSRKSRFRDFDEFAHRSGKNSASSSSRSPKGSKGFHRKAHRVKSQDSRASRGRANRSEYSPYATTVSPGSGEIRHREPEVGLWGGSIGKRGREKKRKMVPFPEKKGDDD